MPDKPKPAKVSQPKNLEEVKAHVMKAEGASFKTSKDKKLGTKTKPKVSIGPLDPVVTPSKDANTEIVEGVAEFGEYHSLLAKDYIVHSKEIEYKSVDINTFKKDGYKVVYEKVVPDEEGFVRKDLLSKINKDDSNTVVINVATGSGKTRTVYEIIEEIIKKDDQGIIILATPFVSLVQKDHKTLRDEYGINNDIITNYKDLADVLSVHDGIVTMDSQKWNIINNFIVNKRIHITTINGLLRNPGEVAFLQKADKSDYFNGLIEYCKHEEKIVYLFLDEIHASIHNFKNEYIHYLTMWKGVIYKCIVSTATYTEPVNIVVKHLAYLTNDSIHVLESERVKSKYVSPLDLVFFEEEYSKESVEDLTYFIKEWIKINVPEQNKFHILCYSKNLVNSIYRELCTIYKKNHFNLLTSQTTKKKDVSFDQNKHNIGTNFATGVDIKKENDALIVIYPCKYTEEQVKGADGIFSDGLPSILQAVARLRKKGRILFTIPPVKYAIKDGPTLSFLNAIPVVDNIALKTETEKFLKKENSLLVDIITEKKLGIKKEEQRYNQDVNEEVKEIKRPDIQFPSDDTFILERGQEFLKGKSLKSGKYITPYVIWGAVNDQFVNCTLDKVYYQKKEHFDLHLQRSNISTDLSTFIYKHLDFAPNKFTFEDFINRAKQLCVKFTSIEGGYKKIYHVNILISYSDYYNNYNEISVNELFIRTDVFFTLVKMYLRVEPNAEIYDQKSYLRYCVDNSDNPHFLKLKELKDKFLKDYRSQRFKNMEIKKLPLIIDSIKYLQELIHDIIENDVFLKALYKKLNRTKPNTSDKQIVGTFLNNFLILGERDRDGRREILD